MNDFKKYFLPPIFPMILFMASLMVLGRYPNSNTLWAALVNRGFFS